MLAKILLLAAAVTVVVAQIGLGKIEEFEGPFEPIPYSFGYSIKDEHGEQHRSEKSDGAGVVTGSYGFVDENGIHRMVYYIADEKGFRAKIVTNEPGTASQNPAGVLMESVQ
ncbi:cuticle protein 10.9-like isoform X2 [Argiope bruennichi]|uniref:Cuticle protein 10.9 like protein n=1 Tax=Argiope bruennichi TaxID=94029 RepID=A0A8T0EHC4_ARGBR|nr:cuticle protein 10.9-like isoform X2 [Argiope bruennichi]KAF8773287.1 Cuticle protein 10.9 like protein [Argiope bruennichi]